MKTQDLGKISYGDALTVQEKLFAAVLDGDLESATVLFYERPLLIGPMPMAFIRVLG